jgi:hypothetical protein
MGVHAIMRACAPFGIAVLLLCASAPAPSRPPSTTCVLRRGRALAFANHPPTTTEKDVSSRGAIEAAATRVTVGFGAVEHCLGKS